MGRFRASHEPTRQEVIRKQLFIQHFMEQAERQNVEVALSNHTALDNGLERIAYARKRMRYMPNIYLIGQKGFRAYCQLFRTWCYDSLEQLDDR